MQGNQRNLAAPVQQIQFATNDVLINHSHAQADASYRIYVLATSPIANHYHSFPRKQRSPVVTVITLLGIGRFVAQMKWLLITLYLVRNDVPSSTIHI